MSGSCSASILQAAPRGGLTPVQWGPGLRLLALERHSGRLAVCMAHRRSPPSANPAALHIVSPHSGTAGPPPACPAQGLLAAGVHPGAHGERAAGAAPAHAGPQGRAGGGGVCGPPGGLRPVAAPAVPGPDRPHCHRCTLGPKKPAMLLSMALPGPAVAGEGSAACAMPGCTLWLTGSVICTGWAVEGVAADALSGVRSDGCSSSPACNPPTPKPFNLKEDPPR